MAKADSILVNDNTTTKDTRAINEFIEPHIFMNKIIKKKSELERSSVVVDIDPRYDYRPDRIAYEYYGQDFWYPAILAVNNMGSMLQFKAETMNFKCKIPSVESILAVLEEISTTGSDAYDLTHTPFNK